MPNRSDIAFNISILLWFVRLDMLDCDVVLFSTVKIAFKRNDMMLNLAPIGVVMFGNHRDGIQGNLRDKAKKLGITVFIKEGGA